MADLTLNLPDRYADYGMEQARANVEAIYVRAWREIKPCDQRP